LQVHSCFKNMKTSLFTSIALLFFLSIGLSSCNHQTITGTGGFADISLNRNSSEYDIKRLPEVSGQGNAFFGIPYMKSNDSKGKSGFIFRFNGVSFGRVPKILPILTLASTTFLAGSAIHDVAGYEIVNCQLKSKIDLGLACLIALPVTGIINNITWRNIAVSNVMHEMNYQLIKNNPDVDVFSNPKYLINNQLGIWTQSADASVNVLGSKIRTERVVIPKAQ